MILLQLAAPLGALATETANVPVVYVTYADANGQTGTAMGQMATGEDGVSYYWAQTTDSPVWPLQITVGVADGSPYYYNVSYFWWNADQTAPVSQQDATAADVTQGRRAGGVLPQRGKRLTTPAPAMCICPPSRFRRPRR